MSNNSTSPATFAELPVIDFMTETDNDHTMEGCCLFCGKKIKTPNPSHVHLLENGNLVATEENLENSQGFFPVGNECKKKVPSNFVF